MTHLIAKKKQAKLAEEMYRKTHFSKPEVEALLAMYGRMTDNKMDRTKFRDILHNTFNMTDDTIMDRVFRVFDKDNDSFISPEEWVSSLSVFLKGTLDEKIKFCFQVYDLNGDGFISREEMFTMLKSSLVRQPTEEDPDEGTKDLVELVLKKMDHDRDSRLSLQDYQKAIEDESLLLEAFGPCLPEHTTRQAFMKTFAENPDETDSEDLYFWQILSPEKPSQS